MSTDTFSKYITISTLLCSCILVHYMGFAGYLHAQGWIYSNVGWTQIRCVKHLNIRKLFYCEHEKEMTLLQASNTWKLLYPYKVIFFLIGFCLPVDKWIINKAKKEARKKYMPKNILNIYMTGSKILNLSGDSSQLEKSTSLFCSQDHIYL